MELDQSEDDYPEGPEKSATNVIDKKKEELNQVFGSRIWGHHLADKPQSESIAEEEAKDIPKDLNTHDSHITPGNVIWVALCGWWLCLIFFLNAGLLFISFIGKRYAPVCYQLGVYCFWPFGRFICETTTADPSQAPRTEAEPLIEEANVPKWSGERIAWSIITCLFLVPVVASTALFNWFWVLSIPMGKSLFEVTKILFKDPGTITVVDTYAAASRHRVLLCNYRAFNPYFFRYKVFGMNVVFFNLFPVVLFRIGLIITEMITGHELLGIVIRFIIDLLCIIPITFYIGNAVSSIAAQTTYMLGALLNVTFGSVVNLILFGFAMAAGGLTEVILYALAGTLLLDLLLLPGLSAIAGGLKYHNQNFNPVAAGVGSILLFISIVGAFTPTVFYHSFGQFSQACSMCVFNMINSTEDGKNGSAAVICHNCHASQSSASIHQDPLYHSGLRYIMFFTGAFLPLSYFVGLIFTFKTHTHIFTQEEHDEEGDGSPAWSIKVCVAVLAVSVAMAALVADDIVSQLEHITEIVNIPKPFLGVTIMAVVPSMTELVNAIKFALNNQISLSLEIGSSAAVQTALIQIPVLIFLGAILQAVDPTAPDFVLVFPLLCISSCIFAVMTFNYVLQEGKTNYFIGTALLTIYLLLVTSFYFVPQIIETATPPVTMIFV